MDRHAVERDAIRRRTGWNTASTACSKGSVARTSPRHLIRATEPLLQAVDAVFQAGRRRMASRSTACRSIMVAARAGHAGRVELWPPVKPDPDEELDPTAWLGTRQRNAEPRTRLARAIAATIAGWLAAGERLEARDRAIRPGDIMVLVRRRNLFVGDLITALKQRKVPVAGADRLVLTEQLAVQDLIALGRFLLLPEDDLNLATVLKGPLFGFSEDELFVLAHGRGKQNLWERLRRLATEDLLMRQAADRLSNCAAAPIMFRRSSCTRNPRRRWRTPGDAGAAGPRKRPTDRGIPRAGARL